ncbi:unnamed protein product [Rotaria sordida]|uniref:Uncharacterized protein n=1 Tax=Rotaria sordida TaxID=392033 RepID=A0A813VFF4_9BILA|nr:unnamed protein product [Rotaria sordida]
MEFYYPKYHFFRVFDIKFIKVLKFLKFLFHGQTYQYNYTINTGSCAWIGLAGHALGGGLGELITINKTHEPELYWALRGSGGGLFVIVTEFKIRLVKAPPLARRFSSIWYPNATKLVMQRYQSLLFDDKISNFSNNLVLAMGIDGDSGDNQQLLLDGLTYPTYYFKAKHLFYDGPISSHSLDKFIDRLASGDGQINMGFNSWDGYLSTIPADETAFPHRHFKFDIQFTVYPNDEQHEQQ